MFLAYGTSWVWGSGFGVLLLFLLFFVLLLLFVFLVCLLLFFPIVLLLFSSRFFFESRMQVRIKQPYWDRNLPVEIQFSRCYSLELARYLRPKSLNNEVLSAIGSLGEKGAEFVHLLLSLPVSQANSAQVGVHRRCFQHAVRRCDSGPRLLPPSPPPCTAAVGATG